MGLLDMLGAGLDDPRNIAALRMGGMISQGAIGQTRPTSLFGLLGQGAGAYSDTMRQARADEMERSKFGMLQDRAQREQDDYQRQLEQAAAQQRQMSEIGMRALSLAGDDPAKRALALADPLEFIKSAQPAPKEIDRVIKTPEGQFGIAKDGSVVQAWPLEADLQNVNGVWVDRNRATSGSVAPQDVNALVTRGEDGQPALNPLAFQARRQIAEAGASKVGVFTEGQANAALFSDRAYEANNVLSALEQSGDINYGGLYAAQEVMDLPAFGSVLAPIANAALSPQQQMYAQAQRNFVNAVLRKESGAVIGKDEFESARLQYFPTPNDDAATIELKRRNREAAIRGLSRASGPSYSFPKTQPIPTPEQPSQSVSKPKQSTQSLKRGDVVDGWRFLGGDPKNKMNWTRVAQ